MNWCENHDIYESGLKMHCYDNRSVYQATHGGVVKHTVSEFDAKLPTAGPVQVHDKFPCDEQIWDAFMKFFTSSISALEYYFNCLEQHNITRGYLHSSDTTKI